MEEPLNDVHTCPNCGQTLLFEEAECDCPGAAIERAKNDAKYMALDNLAQIFGPACQEKGLTPCTNEQYAELVRSTMMVLDGKMEAAAFNFDGTTKAKISLNTKGACVISRNVSSTYKLEG